MPKKSVHRSPAPRTLAPTRQTLTKGRAHARRGSFAEVLRAAPRTTAASNRPLGGRAAPRAPIGIEHQLERRAWDRHEARGRERADGDERHEHAIRIRDERLGLLGPPAPSDAEVSPTTSAPERIAAVQALAERVLKSLQLSQEGGGTLRLELHGRVVRLEHRRGVIRPTVEGEGNETAFARRLERELRAAGVRFDRVELA
ncbi:MAG: hypothetical protein AAF411_07620 [Myxococcota bacterium]